MIATVDLAGLHRAQFRPLVRLAYVFLDDIGQSEDVVQEAFARLLAVPDLRDPEATTAYLRVSVVNLARSALRRRAVARRHAPALARPEAVPLREDQRDVIDALRELPVRQRECLVLRYWADMPEADIATALGISPGSVKTHAHRGIAALAKKLEPRR